MVSTTTTIDAHTVQHYAFAVTSMWTKQMQRAAKSMYYLIGWLEAGIIWDGNQRHKYKVRYTQTVSHARPVEHSTWRGHTAPTMLPSQGPDSIVIRR